MAKKKPKPAPTNGSTPATTPEGLAAELASIFPDLQLTGREAGRKRVFLHHLLNTGHIEQSAQAAGIRRSTCWLWRQTDPAFHAATEKCKELAAEGIEQALWRRAVDGVARGIYYQGVKVAEEREYDTTASIFLLKSLQPWRYRERREVSHELSPAMQALASQWEQLRDEANRCPRPAVLPAYEDPEAIDAEVEPVLPQPLRLRPLGQSTREQTFRMLDRVNGHPRQDDEEEE